MSFTIFQSSFSLTDLSRDCSISKKIPSMKQALNYTFFLSSAVKEAVGTGLQFANRCLGIGPHHFTHTASAYTEVRCSGRPE